MANKNDRWPECVPGKWYIDQSCDGCFLCADEAPQNVRESEDGDYAYVYKQPENAEEEAQLRNAMESCPSEAIGNDGD